MMEHQPEARTHGKHLRRLLSLQSSFREKKWKTLLRSHSDETTLSKCHVLLLLSSLKAFFKLWKAKTC